MDGVSHHSELVSTRYSYVTCSDEFAYIENQTAADVNSVRV